MACAIEKKLRTAGKLRPKIKIRGRVSEWGYQIIVVGTDEILYEAGNNPHDSNPTQNLNPWDDALDIKTLKKFAELTGKKITKEQNGRWFGIEVKPLL